MSKVRVPTNFKKADVGCMMDDVGWLMDEKDDVYR